MEFCDDYGCNSTEQDKILKTNQINIDPVNSNLVINSTLANSPQNDHNKPYLHKSVKNVLDTTKSNK